MKWYTEWNDIKNMQNILNKSRSLALNQQKVLYSYLNRKKGILFGSRLGECFLKEYGQIVYELSPNKLEHLQTDIRGINNVLKRGSEWKEDIWEELYISIVKDKAVTFYTNLGTVFLEIFRGKLNLEKNKKYQELLSDFQKIEEIYRQVDFTQGANGEKMTEVLSKNEANIFHTWLGHSFIAQLQRSYLAKKVMKNKRLQRVIKGFSFVFLAGMISLFSIGIYERVQSANRIRDLRNQKKVILSEPDTDTEVKEETVSPEPLAQYKEIAEQYPDFFGWITVPGTKIDYPVMQARDGFYLDHDYTGEESLEGAVFVDAKAKNIPLDNFVVVYGHNMKNGNIFGELKKFLNREFVSENPDIHFDTAYETNEYQVVVVLKTHILNKSEEGFRYYQTFGYQSEDEFQECCEFIRANAVIETDEELTYGDEILMLSTCEYSEENGRLVIVAKKKQTRGRT